MNEIAAVFLKELMEFCTPNMGFASFAKYLNTKDLGIIKSLKTF